MPSSSVTGGLSLLRTSNTVKRRSLLGSSAVTLPSTTTVPSLPFQSTGLPIFQLDTISPSIPPKLLIHCLVYSGLVSTSQTFWAGAFISIDLSTKSFSAFMPIHSNHVRQLYEPLD